MNLEGNDFVHIPLDDGDPNSRLVDLNLYSGYKLIYNQLLEGGGIDQRRDFLYIISKIGKPIYENALEWCAGPGVIGFELLGFNKIKHLHLMDRHKPAIDTCIENANKNNLQDKVSFYLADKILNLDSDKKFDLVVGNPPHMFDYTPDSSGWPNQTTEFDLFENQKRIALDQDMAIHKEFFDNLQDKVTDDCDIFISEVGDVNPVIRYAKEKGYDLIAKWFMRSTPSSSGEIIHFRPKFSGFVI